MARGMRGAARATRPWRRRRGVGTRVRTRARGATAATRAGARSPTAATWRGTPAPRTASAARSRAARAHGASRGGSTCASTSARTRRDASSSATCAARPANRPRRCACTAPRTRRACTRALSAARGSSGARSCARTRACTPASARTRAPAAAPSGCAGSSPRTAARTRRAARRRACLEPATSVLSERRAPAPLDSEPRPTRPPEDSMQYTATHVERTSRDEFVAKKLTPDTIIPIRRRRSTPATPPPRAAPSVSPPLVPSHSSCDTAEAWSSAPVLLLLRAAGTVEFDDEQNITAHNSPPLGAAAERCEIGDGDIEPETVGKPRRGFAESELNGEDASPKRTNEFSDHSDTENEFGRLPESVFDAIEDTEDGHSSDSGRASPPEAVEGRRESSSRPKRAIDTDIHLTCNECNKVFASKERLAIHKRTHTQERPFPCRVCGKTFSAAAGRYIHERTHSARREHACGQCGRAFRWRAALARHAARHAGRREHVCDACGRGFNLRADLTRHASAHRPGDHPCYLCGERFKQKRYLKVHLENKHFARSAETETRAGNGGTDSSYVLPKRVFKTSKAKSLPAAAAPERESSLMSPSASSDI